MKFDIEAVLNGVKVAFDAYTAIEDAAGSIADLLHDQGQGELKQRLAALRADNDAARTRRKAKLARAAAR